MKQTHSRPNDLMSNDSQLGVVLFQYDWQNPFMTAVTGNTIWNCICYLETLYIQVFQCIKYYGKLQD